MTDLDYANRQTDKLINSQTETIAERQIDKPINSLKSSETETKADRLTDRHKNLLTDRQTFLYTPTLYGYQYL